MRTAGERTVGAGDLLPFEGLVHSTARKFAPQLRREEEDLAQELRIVVWRAVRKHDPGRSSLPLKKYVFGCMTNRLKDFKRDAAREAKRREDNGLTFLHIEDMTPGGMMEGSNPQEAFDSRYNFIDRDEVYRRIDEGLFVLPAGVTELEATVLVFLMMEMTERDIVVRLGIMRAEVKACIGALQEKFADWSPGLRDDSSCVVSIASVGERPSGRALERAA